MTLHLHFLQVDGSWGVDWDGPVATENIVESTVTIPEPSVVLRDIVVSRLRSCIDPLMHSNSFGVDLYKEAVNLSSSVVRLQPNQVELKGNLGV